MDDGDRDYARLPDSDGFVDPEIGIITPQFSVNKWSQLVWWVKVVFLGLLVLVVAAVLVLYVTPFLLNKVIRPVLHWEAATISRLILAMLLFVSLATFPSLLLPSAPSMWIAGVTFGYGIDLQVHSSVRNACGHGYLMQRWLEKWPEKAAIVRLTGEGDWFHQFRAVALLRISPFPYILFNYAAVATNITYGPYICGSLAGTVHETFLTIYSGILIWTVADASDDGGLLAVQQLIYDGLGLCVTVSSTAAITVYAKKALRNLQVEDGSTVYLN